MSYRISITSRFEKDIKRLNKKYPSLRSDFAELISKLSRDPFLGEPIGSHCYKIRMAILSKSKGKSGGARVITYVHVIGETIYMVAIYDKGERETISDKEIEQLLKAIED